MKTLYALNEIIIKSSTGDPLREAGKEVTNRKALLSLLDQLPLRDVKTTLAIMKALPAIKDQPEINEIELEDAHFDALWDVIKNNLSAIPGVLAISLCTNVFRQEE
ncbi:MAG: hypothetical protein ACXABY_12960 [Candidatus Thorarchaeota archaeon]|jgi:hypothetical protein